APAGVADGWPPSPRSGRPSPAVRWSTPLRHRRPARRSPLPAPAMRRTPARRWGCAGGCGCTGTGRGEPSGGGQVLVLQPHIVVGRIMQLLDLCVAEQAHEPGRVAQPQFALADHLARCDQAGGAVDVDALAEAGGDALVAAQGTHRPILAAPWFGRGIALDFGRRERHADGPKETA